MRRGCRRVLRWATIGLFIFFCIIPLLIALFQEATGIVVLPTEEALPTVAMLASATNSPEPTLTDTPTATMTYTVLPTATFTPTASATITDTPLPTATITNTSVPTRTIAPTAIPTEAAFGPSDDAEAEALILPMLQIVSDLDIESVDIVENSVDRSIFIAYRSNASTEEDLMTELGYIFGAIAPLDRDWNLQLDGMLIIMGNQNGDAIGTIGAYMTDVHAFVDGRLTPTSFVERLIIDAFGG